MQIKIKVLYLRIIKNKHKMKTIKEQPRLFLTDYASYNNGTQFEFGHWVDLDQFNDEVEFQEYIDNHFAECDKTSPLQCGSKREETMFTDYEGFPEQFYGESMSDIDMERLFEFLNMDSYDQEKVIAYFEAVSNNVESALREYSTLDVYSCDKYELFEMYYPEVKESNYLEINYDRFIDECFTEVQINGETKYVSIY